MSSTTPVLRHNMCPPIASFPLRRFEGLQPQANIVEGHETRAIMRKASGDQIHLDNSHIRGTEYWFRDVVHGTVCGDTNMANATAVLYEVSSLVSEGIRFEQIAVLAWSRAQADLIRLELLKSFSPVDGVLLIAVHYFLDFGHREADVVIADLVAADAVNDHAQYTSEAAGPSKALSERVRDSANLRIGLTRARYGQVVIGQASWLTRRPRYNRSGEEERDHAELAHDAFRRKVYVRDKYSV